MRFHRSSAIPIGPGLNPGDIYHVPVSGSLDRVNSYKVDADGNPRFVEGITLDQSNRLEQLTQQLITKLEEDYTKEQIDVIIASAVTQSTASYVPLNPDGTLPNPVTDNNFTLAGEGDYGGGVVVADGHLGILSWDGSSWSKVDEVELPFIDVSDKTDKGGYEGSANDLKNEIESIKYNLPIENDALNSDFSDGINFWNLRTGGMAPTANDNTLTLTGDGSSSEVTIIAGGVQNPYVAGDKVFIKAKIRVTNPDALFIRFSLRQTAQTSTYFVQQGSPTANEWYDMNRIVNITSSTGSAGLNIRHIYGSPEIANGKSVEVQYAMAINLTKTFGAGNEPSLDEINEIIDKFPNRWFEGRYDLYPTSRIIDTQETQASQIRMIEKYTKNFLVNDFVNGDFSLNANWARTDNRTELSFVSNELVVKSIPDTNTNWRGFQQEIPTPTLGDKIYVAIQSLEEVHKPSTSGIYLRGGVTSTSYNGNMTNTRGLNEWGFSSKIIEITEAPSSQVFVAFRSNYLSIGETASSTQRFRYAVCLNLTKIFGAGNEPSLSYIDQLVQNNPNSWIEGKVSLADAQSKGIREYRLNISSIPYNDTSNISYDNDVYPVLFGVKNRTKLGEQTKPTGWLYYSPVAPYDILYSSGVPENPKKLFSWKSELTGSENLSPEYYSPVICKNGDIIFVFRGERSITEPRRNPIIYKSGNYENPEIIDFGSEFKPHAWLQNCGVEYLYDENCIIFGEYTRPQSGSANIWKVTAPFDNPLNWRVVKSYPLEGVGNIEHFHTINYDPYNGRVYSSTGDLDSQSNILESSDFGETWDVVTSGSAIVSRVLNFICQPEGVYWGTDDSRHIFWYAPRDENGSIEWENRRILFDFIYKGSVQVTYATCLIQEPRGILFLDRHDGITTNPLYVYFYDLENKRMHIVKELGPVNGIPARYGFRNEAVSFYSSISCNKIVCGFGYHPNEIEIEGNGIGSQLNRLNNLTLSIQNSDNNNIIPYVG